MVAQDGESSVVVRLDSRGNVSFIDMVMGSGFFRGAVQEAVKGWKFPPAPPTMGVDDPPRQVTVTLSFKLNCHDDAKKP
ncbi:MAG TPA: energy transducer TonB [Verrucomicrobiae bacterium]|nr:energy transducer TonB [Verrucomicrobiae bacterium]